MSQNESKTVEIKLETLWDPVGVSSSNESSLSKTRVPDVNAKRVGIRTLGCKVNSYESELIGEALKTQDWQIVPADQEADLYLVNTCTVTKEADRQARQEVRKAIKRNPDALVVVTGCYAQMDPKACAQIPGVDLVLGNDRKLDTHELIPKLEEGQLPKVMVGDLDQHVSLPDQLLAGYEAHTRAFVQIQQGCDQGCTFCIIHVARGPSRSLAPSLIKRQVQRLVLNGYPEIVICGVDLGSYGDDFDENIGRFDLVDLLEELLTLDFEPDNPFRIRLSSIDPFHITDRLITLWANEPRICSHMHLSLQSGSTLILKRMKRRYDSAHVRERISKLRKAIPDLIISADVMVGFPTETEEQFLETVSMVEDIQVAFPHTFSYSEREGTPAAKIPGAKQVPVSERKDRNQRLRESAKPIELAAKTRMLGREVWVLPESKIVNDKYVLCRSEQYLSCLVPKTEIEKGKWTRVFLEDLVGDHLLAKTL
ncbi:MAG: tRNA (N(6)-L-threonylcarbamoyladenosine(37)-C(2))-methylthiotransferase MtaB [Gammaproteobacteria bacterium]|nr:tRNA (N(6)-L-threonylcarbamoyladenosine(37)-C(2))-methylthiotransferase MtaB [Gammaproteobacteria bacterium]